MREKTLAHRKFKDDVPQEIKLKRLEILNEEYLRLLKLKLEKYIGT